MDEIYINYSKFRLIRWGGWYNWTIEVIGEYRDPINYSDEERSIILEYLKVFNNREDYDPYFESMIYALGDTEIIDKYERSFGPKCNVGVKNLILSKNTEDLKPYTRVPHSVTISDDTRDYTIIDLMEDLVKDKSKILVDRELLGTYNRITKQVIDKSKLSSKVDYEEWNKIIGLVDNSKRANLSLSYVVPVSIEVPENTFNIPSGRKELSSIRTVCIIKDGTLWTPKIAIKVNSLDFKNKLKQLPAFECNIVFDDELILDLTKMPIRQKESGSIKDMLRNVEKNLAIGAIQLNYYDKLVYKFKNSIAVVPDKIPKPVITDEEKFLHSLGIYGNTYIPRSTKSVKTDTYTVLSLQSTTTLMDSFKTRLNKSVKDFINSGKSAGDSIHMILDSFPKPTTLEEAENMLKLAKKEFDLDTKIKKRCIFDILTSKASEFSFIQSSNSKSGKFTESINIDKLCSTWIVSIGEESIES